MTGEKLRRDVHPAEVALPDGTVLQGLRVFVTSHRVVGFAAGAGGRVERVLDMELVEPFSVPASRGSLSGSLECVTPEGTSWINRGRGCGCGSPLNALAPPVDWHGVVAA